MLIAESLPSDEEKVFNSSLTLSSYLLAFFIYLIPEIITLIFHKSIWSYGLKDAFECFLNKDFLLAWRFLFILWFFFSFIRLDLKPYVLTLGILILLSIYFGGEIAIFFLCVHITYYNLFHPNNQSCKLVLFSYALFCLIIPLSYLDKFVFGLFFLPTAILGLKKFFFSDKFIRFIALILGIIPFFYSSQAIFNPFSQSLLSLFSIVNILRIFFYFNDWIRGRIPQQNNLSNFLWIFFSPGNFPFIGKNYPEYGGGGNYILSKIFNQNFNTLIKKGSIYFFQCLISLLCLYLMKKFIVPYLHALNHGISLPLTSSGILFLKRGFTGSFEMGLSMVLAQVYLFLNLMALSSFLRFVWCFHGADLGGDFNSPWKSRSFGDFWKRYSAFWRIYLVDNFYHYLVILLNSKLSAFWSKIFMILSIGVLINAGLHYLLQFFENTNLPIFGFAYFPCFGLFLIFEEALHHKFPKYKKWVDKKKWSGIFLFPLIFYYYSIIHIFFFPNPQIKFYARLIWFFKMLVPVNF